MQRVHSHARQWWHYYATSARLVARPAAGEIHESDALEFGVDGRSTRRARPESAATTARWSTRSAAVGPRHPQRHALHFNPPEYGAIVPIRARSTGNVIERLRRRGHEGVRRLRSAATVIRRSAVLTIYPAPDQIDHLVPPLEPGETEIYDVLVAHLTSVAEDWHLIVQPHMLGNHPDFVLVAAHHGVTVIEVKDYTPDNYRTRGGRLQVYDSRQSGWQTMTDARGRDPLSVVHGYRSQLSRTYLTPPGQEERFGRVRGCLVLPHWHERTAKDLFLGVTDLAEHDARAIGVMGKTALRDVQRLAVGGKGNEPAGRIPQHWVDRIIGRLAEPEARADGRRPLEMSTGARNIAVNRDGANRRYVRGPAGSGKTVGIAARAGELAHLGQRVLTLTFNITLAHYVQDLVRRHCRTLRADASLVDVTHFHGFCVQVVGDISFRDPDDLFRVAKGCYEQGVGRPVYYDAVLVDEGQDFDARWWDFLRQHVLRPTGARGEMVIAVDTTQTLYGNRGWVDGPMPERDLPRPTHLRGSYRLPPDLVPIVNEYASRYLDADDLDLPTIPPDRQKRAIPGSNRVWQNAPKHQVPERVVAAVMDLCERHSINAADVVILASHSLGVTVMPQIEAALSMPTEYIFAEDREEQQSRKRRFWPGVAALKGATIHSFKGWESSALVVCLDERMVREESVQASVLAYVAITRAKATAGGRPAHVTVVNSLRQFDGFAATFERHVGTGEAAALAGQVALDLDRDEGSSGRVERRRKVRESPPPTDPEDVPF